MDMLGLKETSMELESLYTSHDIQLALASSTLRPDHAKLNILLSIFQPITHLHTLHEHA